MELRETYEEERRRLLEEGRLEEWARMFEQKLGRSLGDADRAVLRNRVARLRPERVREVLLDLTPAALEVWLADAEAP